MVTQRLINRYSAFYLGWCVAFGEHELADEQQRDIQWLFGEDKVGIILTAELSLRFLRELLGRDEVPEIVLDSNAVRVNALQYTMADEQDRQGLQRLRGFLDCADPVHMFLSSHFCYPPGTRIVTFAKKKPLPIMYKEIAPLRLRLG